MASAEAKTEETKCPFAVGDVMICYPHTAGVSRYPVFGRITKKTPTGRFRITFLTKLRPPCDRNTRGTWGSKTLVAPDLERLSTQSVRSRPGTRNGRRIYRPARMPCISPLRGNGGCRAQSTGMSTTMEIN